MDQILLKSTANGMKKLTFLAVSAPLFATQAWALHHKEPATLRNTAILSLIILPPLALLGIFRMQKWLVGRKNKEMLEKMAATDQRFDPETVSIAVKETLEVVLRAIQTGDRDELKALLTPEFRGRYEQEPAFFNDYESLSFDIFLPADSASRCIEVVVTCGRKSRMNTRNPSVEEAWKFIESDRGWLLDSIREVEVSEYFEL